VLAGRPVLPVRQVEHEEVVRGGGGGGGAAAGSRVHVAQQVHVQRHLAAVVPGAQGHPARGTLANTGAQGHPAHGTLANTDTGGGSLMHFDECVTLHVAQHIT